MGFRRSLVVRLGTDSCALRSASPSAIWLAMLRSPATSTACVCAAERVAGSPRVIPPPDGRPGVAGHQRPYPVRRAAGVSRSPAHDGTAIDLHLGVLAGS